MIKVDLHIHTVSSPLEEEFEFDVALLKRHVVENKLDVIAVTNHNLFDKGNYDYVASELEETGCSVLPGVELSASKTHFVIVCDPCDIAVLEDGCKKLAERDLEPETLEDMLALFPNLADWICIPHFKKDPGASEAVLRVFDRYIDALETTSLKKAIELTKAQVCKKPLVCFTDCRFGGNAEPKPASVYLRTDGRTCASIKAGLSSESGVMYNAAGTNQFELGDGVLASETLNVLIGKRSSGKTFTLKRVASMCDDDEVYFIEQGTLTHDSEEEEFYKDLNRRYFDRTGAYYLPWSKLIEKAKERGNREHRQGTVKKYLADLKEYAETSTLADVFSKCPLFSPSLLNELETNEPQKLLEATCVLLNASNFDEDVAPFVNRDALVELARSLEQKAIAVEYKKIAIERANGIIQCVKGKLSAKSAQASYPTPVVPQVASDSLFFNKLSELLAHCWKSKEILNDAGRIAGKYSLVALRKKYPDSISVRSAAGTTEGLGRITQAKPADYLDKIISLQSATTPARGLFDVSYEIRNDRGVKPSGGQRTEFVFFEKLSEAEGHPVVLIDEPEASFDNMFLGEEIARKIRELSKTSTVFVTTHNHVLCFSLNPEKVIYALYDEESESYRLLAGSPRAKDLEGANCTVDTKDTILDLMEAGKTSFDLRRQYYEGI